MKKLTGFLLLTAFCSSIGAFAQENLENVTPQAGLLGEEPVIEQIADRVLIFPQRMALDENTTVMDLLMMFPSALSRNYEDIDEKYVVRVENLNYECDLRMFLSSLKAKYVQKIQICDNPDVMKGSRSLGGVIDINMVRGAMENDIFVGMEVDTKGQKHVPIANAVYGNGKTDVLVTASIEDNSKKGDYDGIARCHSKINTALNQNHNLMYDVSTHYAKSDIEDNVSSRFYGAQVQYDGVFNDAGTALSVVADVEYYDDGSHLVFLNKDNKFRTREVWQIYIVELWTPIANGLELTAGWELDYANTNVNNKMTTYANTVLLEHEEQFKYYKNISDAPTKSTTIQDPNFVTYNNDFYAELDYSVGPLSLTIGDRVMCYQYGMGDEKINNPYNLIIASAKLTPNWHHQIQGSYYRRFIGPDYIDIHNFVRYDALGTPASIGNPNLEYQPADVYRLMYTYSNKKFWTSVIGRYIDTRNEVVATPTTYNYEPITTFANDPSSFQMTNIDASLTYTFGALSLTAGGSYYNQNKSGDAVDYYYARISPVLNLPGKIKINAQAIWCSEQTPEKLLTDSDVYTMLSVQKTFGKHLTLAAQWHDMFCSDLNAANFRLLYRF